LKKKIVLIYLVFLLISLLIPHLCFSLNKDDEYHKYEKLRDDFQELATTYSPFAEYKVIGKSWENNDIFILKITNKLLTHSKPKILIIAGQHAREWLGIETARMTAIWLLQKYSTDNYIKFLFDKAEIWIVPMVNPDGNEFDQKLYSQNPNTIGWRKNKRDNNNNGVFDPGEDGVDLNRNYGIGDVLWEPPLSASDNPKDWSYRGPSPLSEPETQAIASVLNQEFDAFVDLHSYGEYILYPWASQTNPTMDDELFKLLANRINERIRSVHNHSYTIKQAAFLYNKPISGSADDYAYIKGARGTAFTIEVRPRESLTCFFNPGTCFHPSSSEIIPTAEEVFAGIEYLIEWMLKVRYVQKVEVLEDGTCKYSAEWKEKVGNRDLKITKSEVFGGEVLAIPAERCPPQGCPKWAKEFVENEKLKADKVNGEITLEFRITFTDKMGGVGVSLAFGADEREVVAKGWEGNTWVGTCRLKHEDIATKDEEFPSGLGLWVRNKEGSRRGCNFIKIKASGIDTNPVTIAKKVMVKGRWEWEGYEEVSAPAACYEGAEKYGVCKDVGGGEYIDVNHKIYLGDPYVRYVFFTSEL